MGVSGGRPAAARHTLSGEASCGSHGACEGQRRPRTQATMPPAPEALPAADVLGADGHQEAEGGPGRVKGAVVMGQGARGRPGPRLLWAWNRLACSRTLQSRDPTSPCLLSSGRRRRRCRPWRAVGAGEAGWPAGGCSRPRPHPGAGGPGKC